MTMVALLMRRTTLGRTVVLLTVALGLALLGFGAVPGGAAAETALPGTVSVSKSRFMDICRETGGTPYETDNNSVACFYPDGSMSVCNFDTMTCQDYPAIRPGSDFDLVPPSGVVAQPDDPALAPTLDAAPAASHAFAVADDDQERDTTKAKKNAKGNKGKKGGKGRRR